MDVVKVNALEPPVKLDILSIVSVNMADAMFLGAAGTVQVISLVLLATEAILLFLDDSLDEIFAFMGDSWLGWELKGRLVVLLPISIVEIGENRAHIYQNIQLRLLSASFICQERGVAIDTLDVVSRSESKSRLNDPYLIQDDSNTPPITSSIIWLTPNDLGRHVLACSNHTSGQSSLTYTISPIQDTLATAVFTAARILLMPVLVTHHDMGKL